MISEKEYRNKNGVFTIREAAENIAEQQGWNAVAIDTLELQMEIAKKKGFLKAAIRYSSMPLHYENNPCDLVTHENVNAWLKYSGFKYRWHLPGHSIESMEAPVIEQPCLFSREWHAKCKLREAELILAGLEQQTSFHYCEDIFVVDRIRSILELHFKRVIRAKKKELREIDAQFRLLKKQAKASNK